MSTPKDTNRRSATSTQERSDLDMAITELHQTIVRLNKVIDQVKTPEIKAADAKKEALTLQNLLIPRVFH